MVGGLPLFLYAWLENWGPLFWQGPRNECQSDMRIRGFALKSAGDSIFTFFPCLRWSGFFFFFSSPYSSGHCIILANFISRWQLPHLEVGRTTTIHAMTASQPVEKRLGRDLMDFWPRWTHLSHVLGLEDRRGGEGRGGKPRQRSTIEIFQSEVWWQISRMREESLWGSMKKSWYLLTRQVTTLTIVFYIYTVGSGPISWSPSPNGRFQKGRWNSRQWSDYTEAFWILKYVARGGGGMKVGKGEQDD